VNGCGDAGRGAGRQLYIYWRVAAADLGAACAGVRAMQAALRSAHAGLQTKLLQRDDGGSEGGERTLMEVYCQPPGLSDTLQAEIEAAAVALRGWCRGARHVEVFTDAGRV